MPWVPGQSGNPEGRRTEQPWRAMLDRALKQDDGVRLRKAAECLLTLASQGEQWAVKELADRLDGKAIQQIAAQVDGTLQIELVQFADKTAK